MLSLTKKSDTQPVAAPLWHTNFRNFERLPDTKVIRTTFFINTAALVIAVGMLFWLGNREYTNHSLKEQILLAEQQIEANQKQNADAVRLSKQFGELDKRLGQAQAFVHMPVSPSEYFSLLGETLPENISIDYAETRVSNTTKAAVYVLRGRVFGSPDQASGIVSQYVDSLRENSRFNKIFASINLNNINPDPVGGFLLFDVSLTIRK